MIKYRTAESVSTGHPDSLTDYIVNSILDAYLEQDPNTRFAMDGVFKDKYLTLAGEITSDADISQDQIKEIINTCIKEVGYDFTPEVTLHLFKQSPDIALGTNDEVGGAGDQGTITGYACSNNYRMIPLEKALADSLVERMFKYYRLSESYLVRPDMKSQVTLHYDENNKCIIDYVIFACQHYDISDAAEKITELVKQSLLDILPDFQLSEDSISNTKYVVNGTGKFIIGGPEADSGEVGRKVVVDAYGVSVPVGGGTFNGKDPSKVDRSAAYMARYVAKQIVSANLASEVTITVSYAIGKADPVSINYDFHNSISEDSEYIESDIIEACNSLWSFRPQEIIKFLGLKRPIYAIAGLMCHFGQEYKTDLNDNVGITVPWENTDGVQDLLTYLQNHKGGNKNE